MIFARSQERLQALLLAASTSLAVATAAHAHVSTGPLERTPAALIFEGRLDEANVRRLLAELRAGDTLAIDSSSGEPVAALLLGENVVARGIQVVVNGACARECALFVFLPAVRREVPVGASLRFSQSPFVHSEPGSGLGGDALLRRYRSLLRGSGVSERLLHCIDATLARAAKTNLMPAHRDETAVAKQILQRFGVDVEGRYAWYTDPGYRISFAREFSPNMQWLDSEAECPPDESAI